MKVIPLIRVFGIQCMASNQYTKLFFVQGMGDIQNTKCYNIQCKAILQRRYKIYNILDDPEYENPKTLRAHQAILSQRHCTSSCPNQFSMPWNQICIIPKINKIHIPNPIILTKSGYVPPKNKLHYQHLYGLYLVKATIPTIWLCWDVHYMMSTLQHDLMVFRCTKYFSNRNIYKTTQGASHFVV